MLQQKVFPMEPQARSVLIEDDSYYYQVKWDGIRLLAFGQGKKIRLQGRSLKDKTALYPELSVLPDIIKGKSFILDGELVALKEKRPSFYTVMQRERAGPSNVSRLIKLFPVDYMVFDILFLDDTWLLSKPWEVRQQIIEKIIVEHEHLHLTPNYKDGSGLLQAVRDLGMEGVVAKKLDSPYIPGPRKSSYWLKTKVEQTLEAYVGGLTLKDNRPASLLLGLEEDDAGETPGSEKKLRYIGSASSGLKEKDLEGWYKWSRENILSVPPFSNPPPPLPGKKLLWMEPLRKVVVIYNEWTPELKLRAPRLVSPDRSSTNAHEPARLQ
ncbi:MAG: DNA ligase [Dethiobacter sp.]|jgi:bifunctional non-homologous end joining protein LigD|nr:MAG: DNA ligase [Dethiobacter sp.]